MTFDTEDRNQKNLLLIPGSPFREKNRIEAGGSKRKMWGCSSVGRVHKWRKPIMRRRFNPSRLHHSPQNIVPGCLFPVPRCELPIARSRFPATGCPLPVPRSLSVISFLKPESCRLTPGKAFFPPASLGTQGAQGEIQARGSSFEVGRTGGLGRGNMNFSLRETKVFPPD